MSHVNPGGVSDLNLPGEVAVADFVKVDVEGYEKEVVEGMVPAIGAGPVRALLLDYHASVLKKRGINSRDIENMVLAAGMVKKR